MHKEVKSSKKRSSTTKAKLSVAKKRYNFLRRKSSSSTQPALEGFVDFSFYVLKVIRDNRGVFGRLVLLYSALTIIIIGFDQQNQYSNVYQSLKSSASQVNDGLINGLSQSFVLFGTTFSGSLNNSLTVPQQTFVGITYFMMWLIVIWFLRHRLAGTVVSLRDAVYNAGAPLVSSILLVLLALVQLLPATVGILIYSAATAGGILKGPLEIAIFAVFAVLLTILSFYWLTTTLFALLIVTVPGTYPMKAIHSAKEIVVGQRYRLITRLFWLAGQLFLTWLIVLLPTVLINSVINLPQLPLVIVVAQILTGWSIIYASSYVYLLYRKMINEPVTN